MTSTITYGVCTVFISLYINHFLTLLPSLTKSVPDLATTIISVLLVVANVYLLDSFSFSKTDRKALLF